MAEHLQGKIRFGVDVLSLDREADLGGDPVVCCLPAPVAADWLGGTVGESLRAVRYSSLVSVTAFFRRAELPGLPEGFGCLIPRDEGRGVLGLLFNHCIFPERVKDPHTVSLTGILRLDGDGASRSSGTSDEEAVAAVSSDVHALFGGTAAPIDAVVSRWPRAIPIYDPEMVARWEAIDAELRRERGGVQLFGNYTGEISLRGMAQAAAHAFGPRR